MKSRKKILMRPSLRPIFDCFLALSLIFIINPPASAFNEEVKGCKNVKSKLKSIDSRTLKFFNEYKKLLNSQGDQYSDVENLKTTRALHRIFQSDRSAFITLLQNKKCLNESQIKNIEWSLQDSSESADILLSWIETGIGIPPYDYYRSFQELMDYIKFKKPGFYCPKIGKRTKLLICQEFENGNYWQLLEGHNDSSTDANSNKPKTPEISDYIDGKVSLYGAKILTLKLFEELSAELNKSIPGSLEFVKRVTYPGLINFESPETIERCNNYFTNITLVPGTYSITYTPDVRKLRPDPNWTIKDSKFGEQIVNSIFEGQVFLVPTTIEFKENGRLVDDLITHDLHVAVLNGEIYRFSAC